MLILVMHQLPEQLEPLLVPAAFAILPAVHQEFVKRQIPAVTQFWKQAKVAMMVTPATVIIVPLPV
jgi:hypothetical protein